MGMHTRNFVGNERFQVLSRLGSGGMGAVYHVVDRTQNTRLALKTVGNVDGEKLLRFKREFRALQDIGHPNLISLGELFEVEGEWFYTMELVQGVDFLRYVRTRPMERLVDHTMATESVIANADLPTHTPHQVVPSRSGERPVPEPQSFDSLAGNHLATGLGFDEARLRAGLAQMAEGLNALHRADKVHRDIKPSNVLVTREGRVVILDFGLVTDVKDGIQASDVGIMGTYPYMSPEQASALPVDGRTDWYSMGVMLFQALTGRLPFPGKTIASMSAKIHHEAPEAKTVVPGIPEDLNELCKDLLRKSPDERPPANEILRRLHVEHASDGQGGRSIHWSFGGTLPFLGRDAEMVALRERFDAVLEQRGHNVVLTGESGIGKTELVDRFLRDAGNAHPGAIILRGRCFERESVPFKSIDGVIDALSSHLARVPDDSIRRFVPQHPELLARAFPVLKRVDYFADPRPLEIRDPQEQRARVFVAMRTLFVRLATRDPVIMVIEDLQWLDEDSRSLLTEILREPGAPPMLFIGTMRSSGTPEDDQSLMEIVDAFRAEPMHLGRLTLEQSEILAGELLTAFGGEPAQAKEIAAEAEGHPLFIDELARHAEVRATEDLRALNLDEAIASRARDLPEEDRQLLQILSVAEGPLAASVTGAVAEMEPAELRRRASALRVQRLIRMGGGRSTDTLELYHARIGPALLAPLTDDDKKAIHERIARALQAEPDADPVALATHFRGAGKLHRAAVYAARAGDRAAEALAFDRAASLYQMSLELEPTDGPELEERHLKLAEALANAGRGRDAGSTYLLALETARPADAVDLKRRAAEQFLLSGHIAQGIETFKSVLASLKIRYPESGVGVVLSILWNRLRLKLRGFRFKERDESLLAREDLLRVDACYSAAMGLTPTDTLRGFDFYGRALLFALKIGEPGRVAEHMAIEACHRVTSSAKGRQRAFRILHRARLIANRVGAPHVRGVVSYSEGITAYLTGEWQIALESLEKAERLFREECVQAPGEIRTMQACIVHCLWELGEWQALQRRLSRALKEVKERGDLFTEATISAGLNLQAHCMRDDAERGIRDAGRIMEGWSGKTFDVQRYMHLFHGSSALVYCGDHEAALDRLDREWPNAKRSLLMQVQLMHAGAYQIRGLVTLAHAAKAPGSRTKLAKRALKDAKRMIRQDAAWAQACGFLLKGSALAIQGKIPEGLSWLDVGIAKCETAGMAGRAMAGRWAKGALIGGPDGEGLVDQARSFFVQAGVRRPERFAPTLAPILFAHDLLAIAPEPAVFEAPIEVPQREATERAPGSLT